MQLITLLFTIAITGASAQTQQHGVVAIGGAPSSPAQPVTSLPGACQVGEQLFKTNAPAGNNLYGCTATNIWTLLAGGVGGSGGLAQFDMTKTSATIFTLCSTCASNTPGVVMNNGIQAASITASVTGTISGANASGTIFTYLANGNVPTIAHNTAATITPSAGWTVATGIAVLPTDVVASFWAITFTNNVIDTIAPATMDIRGVYNLTLAGTNVTRARDGSNGNVTFSSNGSIDSSFQYYPTASLAIGTGFVAMGWTSDTGLIAAYGNSGFYAISIAKATGAHFAYVPVRIPVGWNGTVKVRSNFYMAANSTGTGTGNHDYSLACYVPGTTDVYTAGLSWQTPVVVAFNVTSFTAGAVDIPVFSGGSIPSCSPGTLGSETGALLFIRIIRENNGTATDDTKLFGFEVALPHTVQ